MEKKQNKPQNQKQNNNSKNLSQNQNNKGRIDNYLDQMHGMDVELYVSYGNTVLQLQGNLYAKARYEVILEFKDEKGRSQKLIINKAYIIMAKPLP